ncbi:hydrogenase expression/formation protein [Ideonella sp. 4Y16]|uniref:hydrogenase expression/formation protein n=1 Tax=Ideonella alba TaxID=2824118 RepID=UPI001B37FA10|nr:hydrogenase expression/formation protein [Ideonella alba]MBQ0944134.1 hydrogenase expression/formation protein [Ideonella alba]
MNTTSRPFPIPVIAQTPGGLPVDDGLEYLSMPRGMDTYQPPSLPEPEELAGHDGARQALHAVLAALRQAAAGEAAAPVSLQGLSADDLALIHQVLGEGEVSAQVLAAPGDLSRPGVLQVQESVFAGVWRVIGDRGDGTLIDHVEAGPIPALLISAAREDARLAPAAMPLPAEASNAQAVLVELAEHRQHWRAGRPAEVVNLSLLPLSALDIGLMDAQIGTGRVLILSRGYGNCRITNACVPNTWRVVYYNSQDTVILNSVEVCAIPEVACAAPEDLQDSVERLAEVLEWVDGAGA